MNVLATQVLNKFLLREHYHKIRKVTESSVFYCMLFNLDESGRKTKINLHGFKLKLLVIIVLNGS
jgi:hypothetical protein